MQCPLISPHQLWWLAGWWSCCCCLITRCRPAICLSGDSRPPPHKSRANGDQIIVPLRAEMAGKSIERANWWIKQEI